MKVKERKDQIRDFNIVGIMKKEVKSEGSSRSVTWAGHTASHSLQAMHLSSPLAYLRSWLKPLIQSDCTTPSQCVLPTESGGQRPLLKGVVDGGGLFEDVPQSHRHASAQLGDKQAVSSIVGHLTP